MSRSSSTSAPFLWSAFLAVLLVVFGGVNAAYADDDPDTIIAGGNDAQYDVSGSRRETSVAAPRGRPAGSKGGQPNHGHRDSTKPKSATAAHLSPFVNVWRKVSQGSRDCAGAGAACVPTVGVCGAAGLAQSVLGGRAPVAQVGSRRDTRSGASTSLGARCHTPVIGGASSGGVTADGAPAPAPVVVTVSRRQFAALPVAPAVAHAGPPAGYLPVGMDLIAYADPSDQVLDTVLLGTPVRVRAIPVSYHWDFGDGSTLNTTSPGHPYPSHDVASRYEHEGWYDVRLTTTFAGQYSVAGGTWEDIDGTITVDSDPVAVYSKSYESRLVPADPAQRPTGEDTLPPHTAANAGAPATHPTHRSR